MRILLTILFLITLSCKSTKPEINKSELLRISCCGGSFNAPLKFDSIHFYGKPKPQPAIHDTIINGKTYTCIHGEPKYFFTH